MVTSRGAVPLNRPWRPALSAAAMQTFRVVRPRTPAFEQPATCADVDCAPHLHGWTTTLDETTDQGAASAHYIRTASGRGFTEERTAAGLTVFTFPAGQRCFRADEHRVATEAAPLFLVRGGDHRGNPRQWTRRHSGADPWLDDFRTTQSSHADRLARG